MVFDVWGCSYENKIAHNNAKQRLFQIACFVKATLISLYPNEIAIIMQKRLFLLACFVQAMVAMLSLHPMKSHVPAMNRISLLSVETLGTSEGGSQTRRHKKTIWERDGINKMGSVCRHVARRWQQQKIGIFATALFFRALDRRIVRGTERAVTFAGKQVIWTPVSAPISQIARSIRLQGWIWDGKRLVQQTRSQRGQDEGCEQDK